MHKLTPASVTMALFLLQCASNHENIDARAGQANARSNTSAVTTATATTQLAVEVEITASGVTPLGATLVQAPPRSNSAIADLRVETQGGERHSYTMPDPRLAEVDQEGERVLPSATWYVYAPLSASLTSISITPIAAAGRPVSRGGTIDARPLLVSACQKAQSALPACREILAQTRPR